MDSKEIINELERNISVFKTLLGGIPEEQYRGNPSLADGVFLKLYVIYLTKKRRISGHG
jgi:hypothetical protein